MWCVASSTAPACCLRPGGRRIHDPHGKSRRSLVDPAVLSFFSFQMGDPFLMGTAGAAEQQELVRLRRENKELREEAAKLRVQVQAATTPTLRLTTAVAAHSPTSTQSAKVPSGDSATVKNLKEQFAREEAISKALAAKVKGLQERLEAFAADVCEREQGYRLAFARFHAELEEKKNLCNSLQRQVQVMHDHQQPQASPRSTTLPAVVGATARPAVPLEAATALAGSIESLAALYQQLTGTAVVTPGVPPVRSRRQPAAPDDGRCNTAPVAEDPPSALAADPHAAPAAVVPLAVAGAGALRAANPELRKTRRTAAAARSVVPASKSTAAPPRKRARTAVQPPSLDTSLTGDGSSLFSHFAANAQVARGASKPAALPPALGFGPDPVGDFLQLMATTSLPSHQDILRRKLMEHCGSDVTVLAEYALHHLQNMSDTRPFPYKALWACMDALVCLDRTVFAALCGAVSPALVHAVGPDRVGAGAEGQLLATVVRMAEVLHRRRYHLTECSSLQNILYAMSIAAMSRWRLDSPSSLDSTETLDPTEDTFAPFMSAAVALCGYDITLERQLREHGCDGVGTELSSSLPTYAIQAVFPVALLSTACTEAQMTRWTDFCDAMGWSYGQVPLQSLGDVAARALTEWPADDEALLTLRLLVLLKGPPYLYTVMNAFGRPPAEGDDSGRPIFSAFVRLLGCAVVDLRLCDDRDEQVQRMMGFLLEYLEQSMEWGYCSATEVLRAATTAHVVAVRAIMELYKGDDVALTVRSTMRGKCLRGALRWLRLQQSAQEESGALVEGHPLFCTALGRRLLEALPTH